MLGPAHDVADKEPEGIAQRGNAAPARIAVADFERGAAGPGGTGGVDQPVQDDIVNPKPAGVEETHDVMASGAVSAEISNGDVADVIRAVPAVDSRADHGRFGGTGRGVGSEDVREREEVVARVSREIFDENVVTSLAQIESVLVEDGLFFAIDGSVSCGGEVDIANYSVRASFEGDRPGVRVDEPEVFNAELFDKGQQDADVAPVAGLAFLCDAGVGAVRALPENFGAVARSARMVSPFQHRGANTANGDVGDGRDVGDAQAAVRAANKIVAAAVGELDAAILQFERGTALDEDRRIEQPEVSRPVRGVIGFRDDDAAARSRRGRDGLVDALRVRPLVRVRSDGFGRRGGGFLCNDRANGQKTQNGCGNDGTGRSTAC